MKGDILWLINIVITGKIVLIELKVSVFAFTFVMNIAQKREYLEMKLLREEILMEFIFADEDTKICIILQN